MFAFRNTNNNTLGTTTLYTFNQITLEIRAKLSTLDNMMNARVALPGKSNRLDNRDISPCRLCIIIVIISIHICCIGNLALSFIISTVEFC